jgi:hypothetical protein
MTGAIPGLSADQIAATESASDDDRNWFNDHPDRQHRIRRGHFGEVPAHPDYLTLIAVRQVTPGVRIRLSFYSASPLPTEELPEAIAAAAFAQILLKSGTHVGAEIGLEAGR